MVSRCFDLINEEFIEIPKNMIKFYEEIECVCKKYNLSISHEDHEGSFIIEQYSPENIKLLRNSLKGY